MRKYIIYSICLFVCGTIFSCQTHDIDPDSAIINDPDSPLLKGKLKTSREILQSSHSHIDYFYDHRGFLAQEKLYEGDELTMTTVYENNDAGQVTKQYTYQGNDASNYNSYITNEYEGSNLIKYSFYRDNTLVEYRIYSYNDGRQARLDIYKDNQLESTVEYQYDSQGRVADELYYDAQHVYTGAKHYEYAVDTTIWYGVDTSGQRTSAPYQKVYNTNGLLIEEAYLYNEPIGRRIVFQYYYNEDGQLIKRKYYDVGAANASGPLIEEVYEYY